MFVEYLFDQQGKYLCIIYVMKRVRSTCCHFIHLCCLQISSGIISTVALKPWMLMAALLCFDSFVPVLVTLTKFQGQCSIKKIYLKMKMKPEVTLLGKIHLIKLKLSWTANKCIIRIIIIPNTVV